MRLYNASSCTPATGTTIHSVRHYNHQEDNMANKAPRSSWRSRPQQPFGSRPAKSNQAAAPTREKPVDTKKRIRKLQAVWPPPSASCSYDGNESTEDVPLTKTHSTMSNTTDTFAAAENQDELFTVSKTETEEEEPTTMKPKDVPVGVTTMEKSQELREDQNGPKVALNPKRQSAPQRKFASAFQSPLRLAKIKFQNSPAGGILQRLNSSLNGGNNNNSNMDRSLDEQHTEINTNLLETRNRSSNDGSSSGQPTMQCDPIFSSDECEEAYPQGNNKDNPALDSTPQLHDRTSSNTFQSPLRKVPPKQQQFSPELSKNETNTTATSETFDGLPGRVSSESFHFDIDLVKSTDEAAAAELHDIAEERHWEARDPPFECDSAISKSSSSTLTSHWYDGPRVSVDNTADPLHRPIAPAPWASCPGGFAGGFAMECDEFPPISANETPQQRVSDVPSSLFHSAWSDQTWPDGDENSWIEFTADPFKCIQRHAYVAKPSPAKVPKSLSASSPTFSPKLDPHFTPLHKFPTTPSSSQLTAPKLQAQANIRCASPGNKQPNEASPEQPPPQPSKMPTRRVPPLLGPILESKYQAKLQEKGRGQPKEADKTFLDESTKTVSRVPDRSRLPETCALAKPADGTIRDAVLRDSAETHSPNSSQEKGKLPEKYAKMKAMGLPDGAVRNAMIRDGVDAGVLDGEFFPVTSLSNVDVKQVDLDRYRRFRLHFEGHGCVRSNTIWAMVQRDSQWIADNIHVDEDEYTRLFQEAKDPVLKKIVKRDGTSVVSIIDSKRANNGGIVLARIKLSYQEISRAVDNFEYEALSVEQIQGLLLFLPTVEEEERLRNHISKAGGKHLLRSETEKFMATMLPISKSKEKMEAMLFMKQFPLTVDGLKIDSRLIRKACEEVMGSSSLRKLFGVLLELANRLNTAGNSRKQKASAIRLDSLCKLNQSKAFDRKTTFLQYIAGLLRRSCQDHVQIREELSTLRRAGKVDLDQMRKDVAEIEARLTDIRRMALCVRDESLSPEAEVEVLQSSPIGQFTLDACLKMASVYQEMEAVNQSCSALLHYFGEEPCDGSKPPNVLRTLSEFCEEFETAVELSCNEDRAARRGLSRNPQGRRVSFSCNENSPQKRLSIGARSSLGSVMDAIRCKAALSSSSSFDV